MILAHHELSSLPALAVMASYLLLWAGVKLKQRKKRKE
jgi:hypothetical protein